MQKRRRPAKISVVKFFREKLKRRRRSAEIIRSKKKRAFADDFKKKRTRNLKFIASKARFKFSKLFKILAAFSLFFAIAGGAVIFFFFSQFFRVTEIQLSRADFRINLVDVAREVEPLRGQNIFLIPKEVWREKILQNLPQIETVEIAKIFPRTLRFSVKTFPIVARLEITIFQENEIDVENRGPQKKVETFFVDRAGKVSIGEPDDENAFLIVEKNSPENFPKFGERVFAPETLREISTSAEKITVGLNWEITRAEFFRAGREVHFHCANGTKFWLDFSTPHAQQLKKLKILAAQTDLLSQKVDYFDLRLREKIIYKMK